MAVKVLFVSVLGFLSLLFLFGCFSQPGGRQVIFNDTNPVTPIFNDTGPVVINATGGCDDLLDPHLRDNCYFNKVSKNPNEDISVCYKIKDARLKDRCVYLLGIAKMEFCPQISDSSLDLRDDCFYSNAESSGKDSICMRIRNMTMVDKCKNAIAQNACANTDEYSKNFCLAARDKDPKYCGLIANKSQECYFDLAKNLSDSSICGKIENQPLNKACETLITGDFSLCKQLQYNTSWDACYQTVAIETNNYSVCDLTVTDTYINACHETLALMNNFPSLCSHLVSEPARDQCYFDVGVKFRDPETCAKIKTSESRDLCAHKMAIAAVRPYFCGFISNDYMRAYQCYGELFFPSRYNITLDLCKEIRNEDIVMKDQCFLTMRERTGNSSICDLITTDSIKARCS